MSQMSELDAAAFAQLETLCVNFYSADREAQRHAHEKLFDRVSDVASIPHFQQILAKSSNLQALLFAANALTKLFTTQWHRVSDVSKSSTRQFLLNFLYTRGAELMRANPVVCSVYVRLLARIVKLQWLESAANQNICDQIQTFLNSTPGCWVVGISFYSALTEDMQPQLGPQLPRMRRTAFSFRDEALPRIFKNAIDTLRQFQSGTFTLANTTEEARLLQTLLQLSLNCLNFDFGGTLPDETTEDKADLVTIPTSWAVVREANLASLYFELYVSCWADPATAQSKAQCARLCLQCLVLTASFRKLFFAREEDRQRHLRSLTSAIARILSTKMGISQDLECYHEFCRLLARLSISTPLADLGQGCLELGGAGSSTMGSFSSLDQRMDWALLKWMQLIYEFTIESLREWYASPHSKHYLLSFWAQISRPLVYNRDIDYPEKLRHFVGDIYHAFVESRLKLSEAFMLLETHERITPELMSQLGGKLACTAEELSLARDVEEPLQNEVSKAEQLDLSAALGLVNFAQASLHLVLHFDRAVELSMDKSFPQSITERRFIWLVSLMGSLIGVQATDRTFLTFSEGTVLLHPRDSPGDLAETETAATASGGSRIKNGNSRRSGSPDDFILEMCKRVFTLMRQQDASQNAVTSVNEEDMELAFFHFLEQFRRVYMGDHARLLIERHSNAIHLDTSSKSQAVFNDEIVTLILTKIFWNLTRKSRLEPVMKKTISLLSDLTSSIMVVSMAGQQTRLVTSGRVLLRSPVITTLIHNAQALRDVAEAIDPIQYGRIRTSLYSLMTHLFFLSRSEKSNTDNGGLPPQSGVGRGDSSATRPAEQIEFFAFLQPLADVIQSLWPPSASGSPEFSKMSLAAPKENETQRRMAISLMRDLRGVLQACSAPETYLHLFNWLVNRPKQQHLCRVHIISMLIDVYWDDPQVAVAALRAGAELVTNRGQRIAFEPSSPNGILLFREASSILSSYGTRLLSSPAIEAIAEPYKQRYKGLALALDMFSSSLFGNFANFGVFEVYGDQTLLNAIRLGLAMWLSIPDTEVAQYPKMHKPLYMFMDLLSRNFVSQLLELDFDALARVFRSFEDGLCSFDVNVVYNSAGALYNICKHFIQRLDYDQYARNPEGSGIVCQVVPKSEEDSEQWRAEAMQIRQFLQNQPLALRRLLHLLFQLLVSGEATSIWSLAGATFALIILHPDEFLLVQQQISEQQQSKAKKEQLADHFRALMTDVGSTLTSENKERFTRNLYSFSQVVRLTMSKGDAELWQQQGARCP